jgi:hypothetical protein
MLESELTLTPAFARGRKVGVPGLEAVRLLEALTIARARSAVRVPAVKHTPQAGCVTRHPAGSPPFRIAEHSGDRNLAPDWKSGAGLAAAGRSRRRRAAAAGNAAGTASFGKQNTGCRVRPPLRPRKIGAAAPGASPGEGVRPGSDPGLTPQRKTSGGFHCAKAAGPDRHGVTARRHRQYY